MGLLSGVLTAPLAPARALLWLAGHLAARAAEESDSPALVHERLMEVEEALAAGEITEEQAAELEDALLARLLGLPSSGPGAP